MKRGIARVLRVTGLAVAIAIQVAWFGQPMLTAFKLLPAALLILTLFRPAIGLLLLAGIGPLTDPLCRWVSSAPGGDRLLEQLVLAAVTGIGLRGWKATPALRLTEPAMLFAAVAVASAIAVQPALWLQRLPGLSAWDHLRGLLGGAYFIRNPLSDPLYHAVLTAEGAALALAVERIARRDPRLVRQILQSTLLGFSGLALLTVGRLVGAALRTPDFLASLVRVATIRYSFMPDLNAAGSLFLMMLVACAGLLFRPTRRVAIVAAGLTAVALGLWITGSRSAFVALPVAVIGLAAVAVARRSGRTRWVAIGAIVTILAAGAGTALVYPASRNASVSLAVRARQIMMHTAFNMWRSSPMWGQGIGRFYELSVDFGSMELLTITGGFGNENAHNNFLQILGEEGLVGLSAVLIVLGAVLVPAWRSERGSPEALRRSLIAAIAVYVLTWLTGHPQLLAGAALPFFLLLGMLASMMDSPRPSRWRAAIVVLAALILFTAPIRADRTIRQTDFEHVGVGLSVWRAALDDVRYREGGATFGLYLPSDGTPVVVPVHRAPGAPDPMVLTVSVGGEPLMDITVSGDAWQRVSLQLPKKHRRYRFADFVVKGAAADSPAPLVLIGKAVRQ